MTASCKLKALEAYNRDVGRGIARIDFGSMDSLTASTGDVIEIRGNRRIVAKCLPLSPSDEGRGIIRFDSFLRDKAGVAIQDTVLVSKIKAIPAEKVIVAPLEAISPIDERYLADALEGVPLVKGDSVMVKYLDARLTFQIIGVEPAVDPVVVGTKTVFRISRKRGKVFSLAVVENQTKDLAQKVASIDEISFYALETSAGDVIEIKGGRKRTVARCLSLPDQVDVVALDKNMLFNAGVVVGDTVEIRKIWPAIAEKITISIPSTNNIHHELIRDLREIPLTVGDTVMITSDGKRLPAKILDTVPINVDAVLVTEMTSINYVIAPVGSGIKSIGQTFGENKVFIVHGHDEASKFELARILGGFGIEPIILHEQPGEGKTIIEKFEKYSLDVNYAFVLLTPDDVGRASTKEENSSKPRARQNVILELGYFMGRLGRNRVCCLYKEGVEIPSDVLGISYIGFNTKIEDRYRQIYQELRAAGYDINIK